MSIKTITHTIYKDEDNEFEYTFAPIENSITIEKVKDGYKVKYLTIDNNPLDPRKEQDNVTKMVCFHKRYILGDKTDYQSKNYSSWKGLKNDIEKDNHIAGILPIFMYDHSGITISTTSFNDHWDSGIIGFIYITMESIKENWKDIKDEDIEKTALSVLSSDISTYDQYLTGDVYSCVCEKYDSDKHQINYDVVGGYYGYKYALEALKTEF